MNRQQQLLMNKKELLQNGTNLNRPTANRRLTHISRAAEHIGTTTTGIANITTGMNEKMDIMSEEVYALREELQKISTVQDIMQEKQERIGDDVKNYGEKTLKGLKDIKDQGANIISRCFPPRTATNAVICTREFMSIILKLIIFVYRLYFNTLGIFNKITKSYINKIPVLRYILIPIFEIIYIVAFIWLTMAFITITTYGTINGKTAMIYFATLVRHLIENMVSIVYENFNVMLSDVIDVYNKAGYHKWAKLAEDAITESETYKTGSQTIKDVVESASSLKSATDAASDAASDPIGTASNLASSVWAWMTGSTSAAAAGTGAAAGTAAAAGTGAALGTGARMSFGGSGFLDNKSYIDLFSEKENTEFRDLFANTGIEITKLVNIINKTVKLYNELPPEARIIMDSTIILNKDKYLTTEPLKEIPIYKLILSYTPFNNNNTKLLPGKVGGKRNNSRKNKNKSKKGKTKKGKSNKKR